MFTSELATPVIEPVEDRYERDWLELKDDRKVRGFDYMDQERQDREYVDPEAVVVTTDSGDAAPFTGQVETTVDVAGTVTAAHDNNPAGFNQSAFEATLEYNPNA